MPEELARQMQLAGQIQAGIDEHSPAQRADQGAQDAPAPEGAESRAAAAPTAADTLLDADDLTILITTPEALDAEIREIDLLIAELDGELTRVQIHQEEIGHKERSAARKEAEQPFRQHIAELDAERNLLSHARARYETHLYAWATGRREEKPRIEEMSERKLTVVKWTGFEAAALNETLATVLEQSVREAEAAK